jgi:hypothetical protein
MAITIMTTEMTKNTREAFAAKREEIIWDTKVKMVG